MLTASGNSAQRKKRKAPFYQAKEKNLAQSGKGSWFDQNGLK